MQYLIPALGIQPCGGLVQHQHFRLHGQNPGDGRSSFLSPGYLKRRLIVELHGKSHSAQSVKCPQLHLFFVQSQVLRAKTHIVEHIYLKQLVFRVLENQPHPAAEFLPVVIPV